MRGKPTRRIYTEDELRAHKKGDEYVAKRLAEQEALNQYEKIKTDPPPEHLDDLAREEWVRITPHLNQLPIAELDRTLVEAHCIMYSSMRRLNDDVKKHGQTFAVTDREGNDVLRKNPAYDMLVTAVDKIRVLAPQMGMTMGSRMELVAPDKEDEEDEILKLIRG